MSNVNSSLAFANALLGSFGLPQLAVVKSAPVEPVEAANDDATEVTVVKKVTRKVKAFGRKVHDGARLVYSTVAMKLLAAWGWTRARAAAAKQFVVAKTAVAKTVVVTSVKAGYAAVVSSRAVQYAAVKLQAARTWVKTQAAKAHAFGMQYSAYRFVVAQCTRAVAATKRGYTYAKARVQAGYAFVSAKVKAAYAVVRAKTVRTLKVIRNVTLVALVWVASWFLIAAILVLGMLEGLRNRLMAAFGVTAVTETKPNGVTDVVIKREVASSGPAVKVVAAPEVANAQQANRDGMQFRPDAIQGVDYREVVRFFEERHSDNSVRFVEFNAAWGDESNAYAGLVEGAKALKVTFAEEGDSDQVIGSGEIVRTFDPKANRLLIIGTRLGPVVVFERSDAPGTYMYNTSAELAQSGALCLCDNIGLHDLQSIVGVKGKSLNIGQQLEMLYTTLLNAAPGAV